MKEANLKKAMYRMIPILGHSGEKQYYGDISKDRWWAGAWGGRDEQVEHRGC